MKRVYTMVVERDTETGWLVGEVVELPGCYTQAPDLASLERNIQEAIEAWLSVASGEAEHAEFVGTWRVEAPA